MLLKKIFIPVASYIGYMSLKKENHNIVDEKENSYVLTLNKKKYSIQIKEGEKNSIKIIYKNASFKIKSFWKVNENLIEVLINKKKYL